MTLAPSFLSFPAYPSGLSWQSIAVDRSQATAAAFNRNTIVRGGGGDVVTTSRWSAKVGAGLELATLWNGVLCNDSWGMSSRALLYSLPIRIDPTNAGEVGTNGDTVILDVLMQSSGVGGVSTGTFLMQTDGTLAGTPLPGAGGSGLGFIARGNRVECWCSALGVVGTAQAIGFFALQRCRLVVRSARREAPGTVEWSVDGSPVVSMELHTAVGLGPNQGYAALKSSFWPVVSCDIGNLYWADLAILNTSPGLL